MPGEPVRGGPWSRRSNMRKSGARRHFRYPYFNYGCRGLEDITIESIGYSLNALRWTAHDPAKSWEDPTTDRPLPLARKRAILTDYIDMRVTESLQFV
jgi:hypothetical protein